MRWGRSNGRDKMQASTTRTGINDKIIGAMFGLVVSDTGEEESSCGIFVAYDCNEEAAIARFECAFGRHEDCAVSW